jgi:hypothetical protein
VGRTQATAPTLHASIAARPTSFSEALFTRYSVTPTSESSMRTGSFAFGVGWSSTAISLRPATSAVGASGTSTNPSRPLSFADFVAKSEQFNAAANDLALFEVLERVFVELEHLPHHARRFFVSVGVHGDCQNAAAVVPVVVDQTRDSFPLAGL